MKLAVLPISQFKRRWVQALSDLFVRTRFLWIILLASLLLSGCVQYDIGVNFGSPNQGTIVQQIKLGERFISFSGDSAQEWLDSIEHRARQLQGQIKRSNQEITVEIPFNNGAEMAAKFNKFFNPDGQQNRAVKSTADEIPSLDSQLSLTQNNLLLLLRNRLSYDLDLRSSLFSATSNVQVNSREILDLKFSLLTPWGARSIENESSLHPESASQGRQLTWTLKPGQLNHLEAVFWLPSPLAIGTVVIILLVVAGFYLRYNFMPDPQTMRPTPRPITS